MNKVVVSVIIVIVIVVAIFTAVKIFQLSNEHDSLKLEMEMAEEEILDDCTDEYEGMEYEKTTKANTEEEKTSPNCAIIRKTYFKKCGHTKSEYENLPQNLVNLTKDEIQEKYKECMVKYFANNEVVLYKEEESECGEHYIVKDKEGAVTIYQILEDGMQKEIETTGISTEYLPDTDKQNMKDGIQINGKKELNQLIEDFE